MHFSGAWSDERVQVWLVRADLPAPQVARLAAVLDTDERERADAMLLPLQRQRFVVAHGALRLILARQLAVAPAEIVWKRGTNGKPQLVGAGTGLEVNLSHSGDLAVVALAGARAVGVDIERLMTSPIAARISHRYYPTSEADFVAAGNEVEEQASRFVRLWTRKEACVKAAGGRLFQGLRLPVKGDCSPDGIVVRDPGGALPGPYVVRDLPAPRGFRAAVALGGAEPYRVTTRWWWPAAAPAGSTR